MPIQAARPDPSAALAGLGAPPASGSRPSNPASPTPGTGFAALMRQAQTQTPSSPPAQGRPPVDPAREAAPDKAGAAKTGRAEADEAPEAPKGEAIPGDAHRVRAKAAPKSGAGADKPKPDLATAANLPAALNPSEEAELADLPLSVPGPEALRQAKAAPTEQTDLTAPTLTGQPAAPAPPPGAALPSAGEPANALSAQGLQTSAKPPAEATPTSEVAASSQAKPTPKALAAKVDPRAADAAQALNPLVQPSPATNPELASALRTASSGAARADALQPVANPRSPESALSALAWAPGSVPSAISPAGAEQTASAALTPPPGHPDFADALSTQVAVWVGKGVQEAQLQLNPKDMGPVQVWITLDNASAQVRFAAEHSATREALQAALPELAQALARDGIQLGGASVQTSDAGGFAQTRQQGDAPQGGRRAFLPPDATGTGPAPARTIGRPGTNLLDLYA